MPHVVLLFLVARKNPNLANVGSEEAPKDGVPKRASASGNKQDAVCEHNNVSLILGESGGSGAGAPAFASKRKILGRMPQMRHYFQNALVEQCGAVFAACLS